MPISCSPSEADLGAYVGILPEIRLGHGHRSLVDVNQAIIASEASKCLI